MAPRVAELLTDAGFVFTDSELDDLLPGLERHVERLERLRGLATGGNSSLEDPDSVRVDADAHD